jgi:hypothetical protein
MVSGPPPEPTERSIVIFGSRQPPPRRSAPTRPAAAAPSYATARAALIAQVLISGAGSVLAYPMSLALMALAGYTTAQIHGSTQVLILFAGFPGFFHVLAAMQLGRVARGRTYFGISVAASVVQVVTLFFTFGVYSLCLVAPMAICVIAATVNVVKAVGDDDPAKLAGWPVRAKVDLIVSAVGTAVLIGLLVLNNTVNSVEHRHPAREFEAGEADARLDSALGPVLEVLAEVEGMPDPVRMHSDEVPCNDGAGWDDEWSDHNTGHYFEDRGAVVDISPNAGAGRRAIEAVRTHLIDTGWDITRDEQPAAWLYDLSAVRDDGVRISFEVGRGLTALTAHTGCIENVESAGN